MKIEQSKTGEPLLKMTPAFVRKAANYALNRFLDTGREETDTRDFTGVVYPREGVVIVNWTVGEKEKQRSFNIKAV
jgi:hypothetical protein